MLKRAAACCLLGMLFLIGACSPSAPAATATRTPVAPTATPAESATPAPTITPFVRPTLPPTWTPEAATEAVNPTATVDPRFEALRSDPPPPEICGKFGADKDRNVNTITLGSPLPIYWNPARNVSIYEVTVYGPDNSVVGVQRTSNTTMTLRPALFSGYNQPYAWLVVPYDASGNPICLPRGMDIRTASS